MSEKHHHSHSDSHDHTHHHHRYSSKQNIGIALALNATFTIIEMVGGFLTGSIAILSDALHDLGDTLSLALAYFLEHHSNRAANARFSYGYRRLSLVSALITSLVLLIGSVVIIWHAIPRLFDPVQPKVEGMLVLAILGVLVNGFAALKLGGGKSLNEKVLTWHMLEDVFGWVAVLIVSIVMMFWDVPILDPLLSIFFTSFILVGVAKNFFSTLGLFMQAVPSSVDLLGLRSSFLQVTGVNDIHDLHFWSLDGQHHVLTMHAAIDSRVTMEQAETIKGELRKIATQHSLVNTHLTIELESSAIKCPDLDCVSI